ncbi:hypothetical protein [Glutamicibacter arilaitensis]|uniref:hypothetical protein n=1 Tax=Glutamicibacter arilaitensis TaxID=256701 RepID=UPI003FD1EC30
MEPQMQGPMVPPEMLRQRPRKSWLMPAGAGLAVGTVLGLVIGVAMAGGASGATEPEGQESGGLNQGIIDQAVETCGIDEEGYTVLDGGTAIELDTEGEDSYDSGTSDFVAYYCMLNQLGVPETTQQKIGRTRALDGTQSDTWDSLKASWSYHPDSGANVLIEGAN